jgi:diguanylate cyclase (GGDEF)-like protein/PAS domain S-box-containing protein
MSEPLRVLLLEDSSDDAELILRALRRGGYEPEFARAETREEMLAALDGREWDLIISDHNMPRFSATAGLELMREVGVDLPFIIVSGAIGEETAAEAMAAGAGDYVMKDSMRRLVPAIERELREAETRTTRRHAERALHESEGRLRAVMDNVVDAIFTIDANGRIEGLNPAAARLVGREQEDLEGGDFSELLAGSYAAEYAAHFSTYRERGTLPILGVTREVLGRRHDGSVFAMDLALSEMSLGDERLLIAVARDISERKKAESQLRHLAEHDPLTGLANRRRFEEELSRQIAYGQRSGDPAAVLVLDLDNFKYVNDTLGHKAGDELIRRVAGVIGDRVRASDTLARIGGDEFALLLRGADPEGADTAATGVLEAIRREPFVLEGQRVRMTTSIGIAIVGDEAVTSGEILARADQAMYQAKDGGRDRVDRYSPEEREEIEAGRTWSERVREALESDRFILHCQPIVDLATGTTSQYELLLRLRDPDTGELTPPGAFLSTAERFGLMQAIDRWVVGEAADIVARQAAAGRDVFVEVNLSGMSMDSADLPRTVSNALERTGIDPSRLIFEVTETTAIANLEKAAELAEGLTRLGCRFALDDFGVGFASFYYLKRLPITLLKIDGDFVRDLPNSHTDQLVVKALVEISRGLGIQTVGECVETAESLALIKEYGVDFAQGWETGRPGPVETVMGAAADQQVLKNRSTATSTS